MQTGLVTSPFTRYLRYYRCQYLSRVPVVTHYVGRIVLERIIHHDPTRITS